MEFLAATSSVRGKVDDDDDNDDDDDENEEDDEEDDDRHHHHYHHPCRINYTHALIQNWKIRRRKAILFFYYS